MAEFRQNADGSLSVYNEAAGIDVFRAGGPRSPTGGSASVPDFRPGGTMKLGPFVGLVATTGGAIGAWTNNLGYDILVTSAYFDVTTPSVGAANITVGQTPTSIVTASANLIAAASVAAVAFLSSGLGVKVKAGQFITLQGSADTTGLIGNLYLDWVPA